jgi:uncharacterized membrane protein YqaE (UPF0057 family)
MHTNFHGDRFSHSSNIKVIIATIFEAAVLVLLMRGFMEHIIEMGLGAMIYVPSFVKIGSGVQILLRGGYTYRHTDGKVIS